MTESNEWKVKLLKLFVNREIVDITSTVRLAQHGAKLNIMLLKTSHVFISGLWQWM